MPKKKKKAPSYAPQLTFVSVLLLLILGILGIQLPDDLSSFLSPSSVEDVRQETQQSTSSANPGPQELGLATFTQEELANQKKGWISYHPLDSLSRATGADALLKPDMVNTGTPANKDIRPPGFVSGLAPTNHSRGHLIGRQLGGSGDDAKNLTTLYQTPVNTPFMTKYENQVRQALDRGETVRYRVTPVYESTNLLCTSIDLEAKSLEKNSTLDFRVRILNEK